MGSNGSTLILYSSSEVGQDLASTYQAAASPINTSSNGSNLNMAIDIDQAAVLGMSVNDYVASQIGESLFNNVLYAFHEGESGNIAASTNQVFSGSSGLASVVSQSLAPGGFVVLGGCYGTSQVTGQVNNSAFAQGIANAYGSGETVISAGTGPTLNGEYDITPTNAAGEIGQWIVTRPNHG
jgi:hypothetical protein